MIGKTSRLSAAVLAGMMSMAAGSAVAETVKLRILETSDLHANVMAYDYYKDKDSAKLGLARTATLIEQARKEVANSVLVDNGDLIQGSPMGDYIASKGLKAGEVHPVFKAMNLLDYDVATIGNHEFNYGLGFLAEAINDAEFPYVNANVYIKETGENLFKPYVIKQHYVADTEGKIHTIKVGYIGFTPPQVMTWDKKNLTGKVFTKDIKETAEEMVPQMKKEGADVIIALSHSGISSEAYKKGAENVAADLTTVPGIDAVASGHAHGVFPGKKFTNIPGVDVEKGTINGVASAMPGSWGSHLGVIDLVLDNKDGKWEVVDSSSEARAIYNKPEKKVLAKPDPAITAALKADHDATRNFVNQPIGKANDVMYSYLALVQDDPTIQIVNAAQKAYVENFIQGNAELEDIPVLSAAAPFKAGGRKNNPSGYTEVESGQLTFRNAADLYLYPNTLVALKVTGKEVKEWLECSAGQFKQIDVNSTAPQSLLEWDEFRTYNFDVIDGVNYQIDVTQPPKYNGSCKVINPDSQRIVNLTYKGKPVDIKQDFIIASNNYRAYGAKFAGTGSEFVAFDSPDENRSILAAYISEVSKEKGEVTPSADNNWSFAPIKSDKELDIRFETSPSEQAAEFVKAKAQYPMKLVGNDKIGFAIYQIDLQK